MDKLNRIIIKWSGVLLFVLGVIMGTYGTTPHFWVLMLLGLIIELGIQINEYRKQRFLLFFTWPLLMCLYWGGEKWLCSDLDLLMKTDKRLAGYSRGLMSSYVNGGQDTTYRYAGYQGAFFQDHKRIDLQVIYIKHRETKELQLIDVKPRATRNDILMFVPDDSTHTTRQLVQDVDTLVQVAQYNLVSDNLELAEVLKKSGIRARLRGDMSSGSGRSGRMGGGTTVVLRVMIPKDTLERKARQITEDFQKRKGIEL